MITFKHRGNFDLTEKFFRGLKDKKYRPIFEKYGREGIRVLSSATPKDSGLTANSWDYQILTKRNGFDIYWTNSNMVDGIPIVILLQYGHGTKSGSFVEGKDFINPAIKPIFDKIAENLWKEVISL